MVIKSGFLRLEREFCGHGHGRKWAACSTCTRCNAYAYMVRVHSVPSPPHQFPKFFAQNHTRIIQTGSSLRICISHRSPIIEHTTRFRAAPPHLSCRELIIPQNQHLPSAQPAASSSSAQRELPHQNHISIFHHPIDRAAPRSGSTPRSISLFPSLFMGGS